MPSESPAQPLAPDPALLHAAIVVMKSVLLRLIPVCALLGSVFSFSAPGQVARLSVTTTSSQPAASLRQKFASQFLVGVAVDGNPAEDYSRTECEVIRDQFSALMPANCMKMIFLQPEEGRFDFRLADAFVGFAQSNGLKACGHCLVWAKDERTPAWLFKAGTNVVSRDLLLSRMQAHIQAAAGRYRGKVISWDVVNEALDDGDEYIRPSKWFSVLGEDFITKAFEFAHAADPEAVLVYNDYNTELPGKRAKLLHLLHHLQEQKAPIGAVGIQGHWELDAVPYKDIEETIRAIQSLGLKVMITEMDIDVIPRARWWAEGGKFREELARFNPYTNGCPAAVLERQAEQYQKLFAHLPQPCRLRRPRVLLGPA